MWHAFQMGGTMTITLPQELEQELEKFAGASGREPQELVGEALRRFLDYETKLAALRAAIDEGDASGVFEGDAFDSVIAELGL